MSQQYTTIVLLCEDRQHEVFATTFIETYYRIHRRRIRVVPYPQGKGSGEQFVRKSLPLEIAAYRRYCNHIEIALFAIIDADVSTTDEQRQEINSAIRDAG